MLFLIIVVVIGLAGIIGNPYSGLQRMGVIQRSLDDLNQKWRDMK